MSRQRVMPNGSRFVLPAPFPEVARAKPEKGENVSAFLGLFGRGHVATWPVPPG